MDYLTACAKAAIESEKNPHCAIHVCATLHTGDDGLPEVDQEGYEVSNWFDGSVVKSYLNGKHYKK